MSIDALHAAYDAHPLSAASILRRLPQNISLSELDLAIDKAGEITDQNHTGGAEQTIELGRRLKLTANDRVLDLACGLGGSARLLSLLFGCRAVGFDIHAQRIADARRLTALVGLADRVQFHQADVLTSQITESFTVVICQSAMAHFLWNPALLRFGKSFLPGTRLGIEDTCLAQAKTGSDIPELRRLETIWNVTFGSADQWRDRLREMNVRVDLETDFVEEFSAYYKKRHEIAAHHKVEVNSTEREGYLLAFQLAERGIVTYRRWIGEFACNDSGSASRSPS